MGKWKWIISFFKKNNQLLIVVHDFFELWVRTISLLFQCPFTSASIIVENTCPGNGKHVSWKCKTENSKLLNLSISLIYLCITYLSHFKQDLWTTINEKVGLWTKQYSSKDTTIRFTYLSKWLIFLLSSNFSFKLYSSISKHYNYIKSK